MEKVNFNNKNFCYFSRVDEREKSHSAVNGAPYLK